jgi:hypothetical protein
VSPMALKRAAGAARVSRAVRPHRTLIPAASICPRDWNRYIMAAEQGSPHAQYRCGRPRVLCCLRRHA